MSELIDVARWGTTEHRLVGLEGVFDLAIQIEIVLRRLIVQNWFEELQQRVPR